ncbi:AMP-binding protein [Algivirga pacifica]|uniref:AMP-binding protein n=1 Tax=Algivirga pacifica TaxID=1162670 RepID=A0ABP9D513_9BACT
MRIFLDQRSYSFEQVKKGEFEIESLSKYGKQTLQFCHQWLNDQPTFTIHTSGSTGTPKPIQLQRVQMQKSAQMTAHFLGLQEGMTALCNLNTAYIAGIMMLVRAMEVGMEITVQPPSSNPFADMPIPQSFDFIALVPLQVEEILKGEDSRSYLCDSRNIIIGGAPVSYSLSLLIQQHCQQNKVYATYGMTETVSHIALKKLNTTEETLFNTLPGVEIGIDQRGCLWIKTPTSSEPLLQTNDLVQLHGESSFEWLGRADNVINTGGVKVQAEKVEQVIAQKMQELGEERPSCVIGVPDEKYGEKIVLFIEGEDLSKVQLTVLKEQIQAGLGKYEQPKEIRVVKDFPRTPTQKINRHELKEQYRKGLC